jgi:hypothetical protein
VAVDLQLGDGTPRARQGRGALGRGDAVHPEHPVVLSEVAPRGEIRPVRAHDDVLRLDLALGRDAADIDIADAQNVVVVHSAPDVLGDLRIRIRHRVDEQPDLRGGRSRLLHCTLRHGGDDLLQRAPGVAGEQHVVAAAQRDRDRRGLARREVERWQGHRRVERVATGASLLGRQRYAGLPECAEIAFDGPDADLEAPGQLARRSAPRSRGAQLLDERVQAVDAVHVRRLDAAMDRKVTFSVREVS